jgi:copper chaperone CopZ
MQVQPNLETERKTVFVQNIGCAGCVRSIKSAVNDVPGANFITGDEQTKQVTIAWQAPATWGQIVAALTEIEYAPTELMNP